MTFEPYADRRIEFLGVLEVGQTSLKLYAILFGDGPLDEDRFKAGLAVALNEVPRPEVSKGRPGLGFVIQHQGRTGDYIVVAWWDRENELPIRVFVRDGGLWRGATDGESFCVWDMQIIWHERQAYVGAMLSGGHSPGESQYLENVLNVSA